MCVCMWVHVCVHEGACVYVCMRVHVCMCIRVHVCVYEGVCDGLFMLSQVIGNIRRCGTFGECVALWE